ncbi:50S ribosomal protein L3 [Candidatus Roizmanbacteria bacterium]|nr:50S ribosomal protein L3 [Candidatus Roizmanbacteria bacterium]
MVGFSLGEKIHQSQTFTEDGRRVPVTHILTSPCYVLNVKWPSIDGYFAITLGFGKAKNVKKSIKGQLDKAGIKTPLRFLKEIRLERYKDVVTPVEGNGKKGIAVGETKIIIGEELRPVTLFTKGDKVNITGTSKGKGFQGVVRRHKFAGGPKTHGQSDRHRAPGSIGATTTPGRVYKGKRMAGRMGGDTVTVRNLEIVGVTDDALIVKGLVPGTKHNLLEITTSTS